MSRNVCILLSIAVSVPVVFSCCMPIQCQGLQAYAVGSIKDGQNSLTEGFFNVSLDAINKKIYVAGSLNEDGKDISRMILLEYDRGWQYAVTDGYCAKKPLTDAFPDSCLPVDAKKVLSTFLGQGCDALPVDIYSYMIDGKMADLTVTKESCIQVTHSRRKMQHLNHMPGGFFN